MKAKEIKIEFDNDTGPEVVGSSYEREFLVEDRFNRGFYRKIVVDYEFMEMAICIMDDFQEKYERF